MNLQPINQIQFIKSNNIAIPIFDYINLYPNDVKYIHSAIQIQKINHHIHRIIFHYYALPNKNLKSLFDQYVEYYNFRETLNNKIKSIKNTDLNHDIFLYFNELKMFPKQDYQNIFLADLKLMIALLSSICFQYKKDKTDEASQQIWSKVISDSINSSQKTQIEYQNREIQNSILGIIYFLFSLFINIYIKKIYKNYIKEFSVTNQFYSRSRNNNIVSLERLDKFPVNNIIHNIRLPISIIRFSHPIALFLMMIVELLPYLRKIDIISDIISSILSVINISNPQIRYMLCVLVIIIQKRKENTTKYTHFITEILLKNQQSGI